jgi:glycerate kinase
MSGARLVVTGEGRVDSQTLAGKAPIGVASLATSLDVPVVAACGSLAIPPDELAATGIVAAYPLSDFEHVVERSMANAASLLQIVGQRIASDHLLPHTAMK